MLAVESKFVDVPVDQMFTETFNAGVIISDLPDGIAIQQSEFGLGLFATKYFGTNEIVYAERFWVIPDSDDEQKYQVNLPERTIELSSHTHSVKVGCGVRTLFGFGSLINHDCDPNTRSANIIDFQHTLGFVGENYQVSLRPIFPGEQLTSDYNLFDYHCHGHVIDKCQCGSPVCRKKIAGFSSLPLKEQLRLLPQVDKYVAIQFFDDHPELEITLKDQILKNMTKLEVLL